ncbi:type II toxin-antitoxin system death-on-curing family toxin [Metabacillus fastidiosus]|uniref:type II toxin-antitoxin system death-on-curing family toxin n=1 Tax=Metabacillus fastidiosus TaxID=1458 RepID=UPI003D269F06
MIEEFLPLDPDDIRYLHDEQIELYDGVYGEVESGLIDYMAEKPFLVSFGLDMYPTLFLKAAVYLDGFAKNQYFSDGNKRTGVICCLTFLAINGYQLTVTDYELYEFAMKVAESSDPTNEDLEEIPIEEIAQWLEDNSILNLSYI